MSENLTQKHERTQKQLQYCQNSNNKIKYLQTIIKPSQPIRSQVMQLQKSFHSFRLSLNGIQKKCVNVSKTPFFQMEFLLNNYSIPQDFVYRDTNNFFLKFRLRKSNLNLFGSINGNSSKSLLFRI